DILRTAVLWEGLPEPVQVVYRHAVLQLQWLESAQQLDATVDPRHYRIDVRRAPMLGAIAAHDAATGKWLLQILSHHLVDDNTTLKLIVEEIALIQQGRADALAAPVAFRRFVAQARLGVSQAEHETFFRQMLGDVQEPTAPFNLLDVQGDGLEVDEARLSLETGLALRLRQQAQRHGVSAATLFHLAWAMVVGKASGKDDVVFGTVLFGRMQNEGAARALGLFINTLPLRVRLGAQGVAQSLRQTHTALSALLHHEHASLSLAQRCSGLPASTPLFSTLLNYRHTPQGDGASLALGLEGMAVLGDRERTNFPMSMLVNDLGDAFVLIAQVSRTLDAQRVCGLMEAALQGVVEALARQPEHAVSEVELLGEAERAQLRRWSVNGQRHAGEQPVHRLIEQQVRERPDAPALAFGDQSLSYGELNARANRLAHRLIALGVKPESKVGIVAERSVEMVVGILAILKAGGAYVPLDPEYPADRLAYMVEDSGIALLLTQSHLQVPGTEALEVLALDTLDLSAESEADPELDLHGEHLAYVIYTSGSTGRPKGTANRHLALCNRLAWMQDAYRLDGSDAVLQKTPFSFDVSVW
ncbi:AMP-binding protein, partial [Variovorax sp. OK202]|uniref:AMP-binding protein n=2 Tax=unclassified Variovorax TaxID=663243 RepID=UPI0008C1D773